MSETRAVDHYEITVEAAPIPQRWFRSLATLAAHVAALFGAPDPAGVNPGGRRVKVLERSTGDVVLEFVKGHGDDTQVSLSLVQADLESVSLSDFQSRWL